MMENSSDMLYYNYRYLSSKYGRWIRTDPIMENGGDNLYSFCHNLPMSYFDYIGLCSSWGIFDEHTDFTEVGFLRIPEMLEEYGDNVLKKIIEGNLNTDKYPFFDNLSYHFNRPINGAILQGQLDYLFTLFNEYISFFDQMAKLDDPCCQNSSTLSICKAELGRIGRITHMLQDFYAHAVVMDSSFFKTGELSNACPLWPFNMKPSSYDINCNFLKGLFFNGEHGGLLCSEPGNRAPDKWYRKCKSIEWTSFTLIFLLPQWNIRCKQCKTKL